MGPDCGPALSPLLTGSRDAIGIPARLGRRPRDRWLLAHRDDGADALLVGGGRDRRGPRAAPAA